MLKQFLYTANFKLKVIKYAKKQGNRAAERSFGPLPTESVITLWRQQEEKLLQMPRQKKAMRGKPPKAARGGAGGEDLDSGAVSTWDLCFDQDDTRRR